MTAFSSVFEFIFSWLPSGLHIPVMGVFAVAFIIIMVKLLVTVVELFTKVFALFLPG